MHPAYFPGVAAKLEPEAVIVVNTSLFSDPIAGDRWRVHGVSATRVASECGSSLAGALVLVGAFAGLTGLVALDALLAALPQQVAHELRARHGTDDGGGKQSHLIIW